VPSGVTGAKSATKCPSQPLGHTGVGAAKKQGLGAGN